MSREAFGDYQIVEQIGRGAAGTVFVAEHGPLRHQVAIKVLHPHLIGDGWEQRMFAEADVLSRIDHPGIVKVFDMGLADDGRAYVVMEHLAGESLHVRMRRARLTEDRAVAFGRQLASALEAAHRAGVVHRDLKPENVFVVPDSAMPGGERAKLLDFGIAKRKGTEQTATGVVLGTPAYMAPEQFLGSRHVDPRADIYSLGVLLYEMATDTRPFAGRDTGELLAEHAYCMPPSASEVGGVSLGLSAIIERCLAKHRDDRFATMGELGAALRALEPASAAAASSLGEESTLVFATLGDAAADAADIVLQPRLFGDDPNAYLASPPAPVRALTSPPVRLARRRGRGLLALLALAGAALALGYGLGPDVAVADTSGAPTPDMSAAPAADPAGTSTPDMAAARGPIELPAIGSTDPDVPVSPAELAAAAAGSRGAPPAEVMRRAAPTRSAGRAGLPRAGAPARAPRPRAIKKIDPSRKPAKESSYATVSPPTLY